MDVDLTVIWQADFDATSRSDLRGKLIADVGFVFVFLFSFPKHQIRCEFMLLSLHAGVRLQFLHRFVFQRALFVFASTF